MDILLSFLLAFTSCLTVVNSACLTLPVVENAGNNATASGPFPDGTTVQFTCHDGYTPSGNRIYDCNGNTWINGNFECDDIFCKHVDTPRNGYLKDSPTYEVGSFITFRCNEGYTMKGASRLICRINGQWNPDKAPECEIKNCGDFGEVLHGSTFQDNSETERNTYGSVVQVTCDRGYKLTGSPRVSCDKDGNWGAKPVCNAVECDPYPGLTADCVINTRLSGQFLFIACRRDVSVTKTGPSVVKCINNKWVPDPGVELVACFCDCKVNVDSHMSVQNLDADGYLKHNHTLEWSCKNNGKEANEGPLRCVDGKIETPRCILEPETTTQLSVCPNECKDNSDTNGEYHTTTTSSSKLADVYYEGFGLGIATGTGLYMFVGTLIGVVFFCTLRTKCLRTVCPTCPREKSYWYYKINTHEDMGKILTSINIPLHNETNTNSEIRLMLSDEDADSNREYVILGERRPENPYSDLQTNSRHNQISLIMY